MAIFDRDMIARAMQKRDKTRVAVRKSACGAVMIDGLPFSVSVESDGAANNKGVVLVLSGDAVADGSFTVDMIDVSFPAAGGTRTIKRKPELYKKKDGGNVIRLICPEIRLLDCDDPNSLTGIARSEEQLAAGSEHQIIFRFTPRFNGADEQEIMVNIYPAVNPLDGSCTEWVTATSDKDFFEHDGLAKIMGKKKKK